jgi:shikimate 5-dehydrogenase
LPQSANHSFFALIGDSVVEKSPGPHVYNTLFRKKNLPWCYIPIETQQIKPMLQFVEELGALGASITMPHKTEVAKLVPGCPLVTEIGAANTIRFQKKNAMATNTDVSGFEIPLRKAYVTAGEKCLILGAGGAARAAVFACKRIGLVPIVSARDIAKARSNFPNLEVVPWEDRATVHAKILINATSIAGASEHIWPKDISLQKEIVFDCAISKDPSLLLERAKAEGVKTIGPYEMWVSQGAKQLLWITGTHFSEEELRNLLP